MCTRWSISWVASIRHVDPSDPGNLDITVGMYLANASTVQGMMQGLPATLLHVPPYGRELGQLGSNCWLSLMRLLHGGIGVKSSDTLCNCVGCIRVEFIHRLAPVTVWPWVQDAFEQAATDGRIADVERFFQLPHLLQRCSLWGVYHTQHLPVIKLLYPRFTDEGAAWSLQRAASRNHLPIVQYLCDKRPELDVAQALAAAVEMGYLEIVKFLHPRCPAGCSESAVWEALRYERWGVLEYLRDHGNDSFPVLAESLISWNALPGLLHLYPVDRAMHWVKLLHNRDAPGCTSQTMDWAAGKGLLEVVEFLHTHRTEGCTTAAMDQAAAAGHLRVVTFLHNNRTEGCTTAAMDWAAVNGNWDVVQFLHKHRTEGCTFRGLLHTFTSGNLQMVKFLCRHRPETQTMNDMTPNWYYVNNLSDLVILRYYYGSRSSPVDNAAFAHAARAGRLELVKLMYEAKFCDDIEQAMQGARFSRRRQVLQYLEGILAQRK